MAYLEKMQGQNLVRACARLEFDEDFQQLKKLLEQSLRKLQIEMETIDDDKQMYKRLGACILIRELVEKIEKAKTLIQ